FNDQTHCSFHTRIDQLQPFLQREVALFKGIVTDVMALKRKPDTSKFGLRVAQFSTVRSSPDPKMQARLSTTVERTGVSAADETTYIDNSLPSQIVSSLVHLQGTPKSVPGIPLEFSFYDEDGDIHSVVSTVKVLRAEIPASALQPPR